MSESAGGEQLIVGADGEFLHQVHEFHHAVETWLHIDEFVELIINSHDGLHSECYSHV